MNSELKALILRLEIDAVLGLIPSDIEAKFWQWRDSLTGSDSEKKLVNQARNFLNSYQKKD